MLKKSITYTDYNDNEVTEDFYFNFTKLELMEQDLMLDGFESTLTRLQETENNKEAYELFKKIVLASYGQKSEDGRRFIKSDEISLSFEQSPACSELILEFLNDPESGARFIEGTLPAKLIAEVKAAQNNEPKPVSDTPQELRTTNQPPTDEELLKMDPKDMTPDQLQRAYLLKSQQ